MRALLVAEKTYSAFGSGFKRYLSNKAII